MFNLLQDLNEKQKEAVCSPCNNLLILAGAGSGKTKVLVYRILWLLFTKKIPITSIMAVTFTNKAAMEIRKRIFRLIGNIEKNKPIWIGTFHSLAHRFLRFHYMDANLPKNFQIVSDKDQLNLLKRLIKNMNLNEKKWTAIKALRYIISKKNEGLRPNQSKNCQINIEEKVWNSIYSIYQKTCNNFGIVDFSELLLRTCELWINNPKILFRYQKHFSNILIDEFQDTNTLQYAWIKMLSNNNNNIMIVGDDDQSIYGWRGAKIENIKYFLNDFPTSKIIRLERNYRSTKNILHAANSLIIHNDNRLGKKLWTKNSSGELIDIYAASNELDEAFFIVNQIKCYQKNGGKLNKCVILYRSNAQSRIFEEMLIKMSLPYRIYAGMRFFERKEIKDVISYLRFINNHNDDNSFERIINIPTRGIGLKTLEKINEVANSINKNLWETSKFLLENKQLTNNVAFSLNKFLELINFLGKEIKKKLPLYVKIDRIIKFSGIWDMYKKEKEKKDQIKIENLKELVNAAYQFEINKINDDIMNPLCSFLSHISLIENTENENDSIQNNVVQLMTIHAVKGLEFSRVFIVGLEEGLFPNKLAIEKNNKLEEERRLAYVGITRAMEKLTLTYSKYRKLYGKTVIRSPSRFILELPISCTRDVKK